MTAEHRVQFEILQAQFLEAMRAVSEEAVAEFLEELAPESQAGLSIYATGFYARITSTLPRTVFARAKEILPDNYLELLIHEYLNNHKLPQHRIELICKDIAEYARTQSSIPWLHDLLKACVLRWELLTGPDPDTSNTSPPTSLNNCVLAGQGAVVTSQFDLAERWFGSEGTEPTGLFFIKTSSLILHTLSIIEGLWPVAKLLTEGVPLLLALDHCSDKIEAKQIQDFVFELSKRNILSQTSGN